MDWKSKVYKDYEDKIYRFILYHVKVGEVARDLTHDVFVRVYSSYSAREIEHIESLIWTITRNRIVDHHRKVAHSRNYRDYLWSQTRQGNSITEQIEYEETLALFRSALEKLTPRQWKIYTMVREMNLSYREIGKELNISPNTVKNHMVSALRSIRDYLNDHQENVVLLFLMMSILILDGM